MRIQTWTTLCECVSALLLQLGDDGTTIVSECVCVFDQPYLYSSWEKRCQRRRTITPQNIWKKKVPLVKMK